MDKILLFYKYVQITDPYALRENQRTLCQQLNIKGRIWIAQEGINGTVGGNTQSINKYISLMRKNIQFADIDFKESFSDVSIFSKLKVKVRPEIVRLGIAPEIVNAQNAGTHLTPKESHELMRAHPNDLVILDVRNRCESTIGTMTNALTPNINYFRELPKYLENNIVKFEKKRVLMFCTGGIRCERASAFLKAKKIAKKVFQIKGGIHRYVEQYPDGYFRGKNYVFDGRIAVRVNDDILSACTHCKKSCDEYTNCINVECNEQCIICILCIRIMENTCSAYCFDQIRNKKVKVRIKPAKKQSFLKSNEISSS